MEDTLKGTDRVNAINADIAKTGGLGGGAQTQSGMISSDGVNPIAKYAPTTITSESLANTSTPVVVPTVPSPTTAEGISGLAQATIEQNRFAQEQERKAQEAQGAVSSEKGKLEGLMEKYLGVQSSRGQLEKDAGLDVKTQKVTDVTNQLEASTRAQTNELRALDGRGLTDIQKSQQSREINRRYAFEQADLALVQSAANRDLDTASRIIDRKIQLQLEPLQTQLEFTKFFYQENKDLFTKAEDRAFSTRINQLNQEYETAKAGKTAIANIQLEALKNGVNIPQSVLTQLNSAKDATEATSILARNGISLQNPLDVESKKLETESKRLANEKARRELNPVVAKTLVPQRDASGNVVTNESGQPVMVEAATDPFIQNLLNTKGGKALTDTSIQKLDKGLTVLGQLGVLQTNIQGVKTGPITGAFKGANPWDTNAQTIKAQLNAVVPNLARGVYGEVGVLTDADVANYSKTLPNLKSTEEVRNAVLYITLDMIGKSIKNTLSVNAAAGRDVSGFVDIYTEMEAAKQSILSTVPKSQVPKAFKVTTPKGEIDMSLFESK